MILKMSSKIDSSSELIVQSVVQNGRVFFVGVGSLKTLKVKNRLYAPQMDFKMSFENFCDVAYQQTKPHAVIQNWQRPEDPVRVAQLVK